jgi:hypothetical protein
MKLQLSLPISLALFLTMGPMVASPQVTLSGQAVGGNTQDVRQSDADSLEKDFGAEGQRLTSVLADHANRFQAFFSVEGSHFAQDISTELGRIGACLMNEVQKLTNAALLEMRQACDDALNARLSEARTEAFKQWDDIQKNASTEVGQFREELANKMKGLDSSRPKK